MTPEDQLKIMYSEALAQLRQHPTIIWSRNNFFLLVHTALLALALNRNGPPSPLISAAGLFIALIWLWVSFAGRVLQRKWRGIAIGYEQKLFPPGTDGKAVGPLGLAVASGEGSNNFVSITAALILLAVGFVIIWLMVLVWALMNS